MKTDSQKVAYPAVRRNLLRSLSDLSSEEFGHPDHWPEWTEALGYITENTAAEEDEALIGDVFTSSQELVAYQQLIQAIGALPRSAWVRAFGEVSPMAEWASIRRSAQTLYELLTPDPRRRLRLTARSFAIDQVLSGVFLDYRDAKAFLLDELPSRHPERLIGHVLLTDEEVASYRKLATSLRALHDDDGTMSFRGVVQLSGWGNVRDAAAELDRWLKD
jgi:hypothetical protein